MANTFTNPIILDTFSSAIDVCNSLGFAEGTPLKVHSIQWSGGSTVAHTAIVTDAVGGNIVFSEKLDVANKSIVKYYGGMTVKNLCVAINAVASGHLQIILE